MNQYQIAIVALLALQAVTLFLLWRAHTELKWFRKVWIRDSLELLHWKRYGLLRNKLTGRYNKRGES